MNESCEHGTLVLIGLAIYMAVLLCIGWRASRLETGEAGFLVTGRRLGFPLMVGRWLHATRQGEDCHGR